MKKVIVGLWLAYFVSGLPLTILGYLFTGGGTPKFSFLDDYSNPGIVLAWAVGATLIFILPLSALALTGAFLISRRTRR